MEGAHPPYKGNAVSEKNASCKKQIHKKENSIEEMKRNQKKPKILKIHWGFSLKVEKRGAVLDFSPKKMIFIWGFSIDFEKS